VREYGGFSLTSHRSPQFLETVFRMNLAWNRTYEFVSQIYGGLDNLGVDAEGKAVAGEVSFLSVWPGKGVENRGCGRSREWFESRTILGRWGEGGGA
jgi:hypothetical protein